LKTSSQRRGGRVPHSTPARRRAEPEFVRAVLQVGRRIYYRRSYWSGSPIKNGRRLITGADRPDARLDLNEIEDDPLPFGGSVSNGNGSTTDGVGRERGRLATPRATTTKTGSDTTTGPTIVILVGRGTGR
jgi:hypothetical protein